MADGWLDWQQRDGRSRKALLANWSRLPGVYVPSLFKVRNHDGREPQVVALNDTQPRVERALLTNLNHADFPSTPIVPFGRPVHDRLRLELARGCTRGCRF